MDIFYKILHIYSKTKIISFNFQLFICATIVQIQINFIFILRAE